MKKAGILLFSVLVFAGLSRCSRKPTQSAEGPKVFAVCIQHIGAIDSPIFPIVVALNASSEDACRPVVEKESDILAKDTQAFRVSREQLEAIAEHIRRSANATPNQGVCGDFGTFSWTILVDHATTRVATCPKESFQLLSDLRALSIDAGLNHALSETLMRFPPPKA
jgi:hypothetical protein